jgi:hypothetical protein
LSLQYIEANTDDGGCGIDYNQLLEDAVILAIFPLHEKISRGVLQKKWIGVTNLFSRQPLEDIKEYYGTKVALVSLKFL